MGVSVKQALLTITKLDQYCYTVMTCGPLPSGHLGVKAHQYRQHKFDILFSLGTKFCLLLTKQNSEKSKFGSSVVGAHTHILCLFMKKRP